jgi:hypothetical protein
LLDAVGRYHRILEKDPAAAREQAEGLREAFRRERVTFAGEPLPSFVRPHFVARAQWDALREKGVRVMETAARVARLVFDGDVGRLCEFLGTPAAEAAWVALDPGPPDVVLSRLDAFITPAGPRFIEINSDAPAGFGYGDRMARLFRELPVFREVEHELPVAYQPSDEGLVRAVGARWRASGGTGRPRIAIVDWAEVKTRPDQEILRGPRCSRLRLRDRRCGSGRGREGSTRREGRWTWCAPGGPLGLVQHESDMRALRRVPPPPLPFVNSLRCRLSEDKAFFAILTDEAFAHLLSEDERALVAATLPWTRRVAERRTRKDGREIDLVPFMVENRERLVLKPTHEYGGRSVFLGSETAPGEWRPPPPP